MRKNFALIALLSLASLSGITSNTLAMENDGAQQDDALAQWKLNNELKLQVLKIIYKDFTEFGVQPNEEIVDEIPTFINYFIENYSAPLQVIGGDAASKELQQHIEDLKKTAGIIILNNQQTKSLEEALKDIAKHKENTRKNWNKNKTDAQRSKYDANREQYQKVAQEFREAKEKSDKDIKKGNSTTNLGNIQLYLTKLLASLEDVA